MAYSATVTQIGTDLLFTDTSTISGSLVSKVLVISDANNVPLITVNMGSATTYNYTISADAFFIFTMTLVDGAGSHIVEKTFLSYWFFMQTFLNLVKTSCCGCLSDSLYNKVNQATWFLDEAIWYAPLTGYGIQANTAIISANTLINS